MVYLIMGVAGAGKSTVAQALAKELSVPFIEADDFHSKSNLAKMSSGKPLSDADRFPWLQRLNVEIQRYATVVVACSALTQHYRTILLQRVSDYRVVYLSIGQSECLKRLASREGHFFQKQLCSSQYKTLEKPIDEPHTIQVDALMPISNIIKIIRSHM